MTRRAPLPQAAEITEKVLQDRVLKVATFYGWRGYHTHDSRRSQPGFPDLVLAHPGGRLMFVELKTAKGRTTTAQREWLDLLALVPGVEVYLWRPADLLDGTVSTTLIFKRPAAGAA